MVYPPSSLVLEMEDDWKAAGEGRWMRLGAAVAKEGEP
jgi:hypothetical protein